MEIYIRTTEISKLNISISNGELEKAKLNQEGDIKYSGYFKSRKTFPELQIYSKLMLYLNTLYRD